MSTIDQWDIAIDIIRAVSWPVALVIATGLVAEAFGRK